MTDKNNILLITDDEQTASEILKKLVLLRSNDKISVTGTTNYKKLLENSTYSVIILHATEDQNKTLKLVSSIKDLKTNTPILLLLNETNADLIMSAFDIGVYDYVNKNCEPFEIMIKTINCIKLRQIKDVNLRNEKFLNKLGAIDEKTSFYEYKYLKEAFIDFSDNNLVKNGIFLIITLNEKNKTKVSTNRLASIIKNSTRTDDVVAVAKGGKFYLILPNMDITGANAFVEKLQEKMGEEFKLHAGMAKIGIHSFDVLDKNAQDGLTCAIQNDLTTICLENKNINQNAWLEDPDKKFEQKGFKLFKKICDEKMEKVITPIFFRFHKECETRLTNTKVSQYANSIESVFCLKNPDLISELIIRYDGFAKFNVEISHSGLDSVENSRCEIKLNEMNDKILINLLKKLSNEYKQSLKNKDKNNVTTE